LTKQGGSHEQGRLAAVWGPFSHHHAFRPDVFDGGDFADLAITTSQESNIFQSAAIVKIRSFAARITPPGEPSRASGKIAARSFPGGIMKRVTLVGFTAASILLATPVLAADLGSEINNAATHAGLAAQAANINGVHTHLHHALNCIVGPAGDGFDPKSMNPCAQSGNGAIPDETDAAKKAKLAAAEGDLVKGIAETDLAAAQADATAAQTAIASAK
jgi:hypothetical protein